MEVKIEANKEKVEVLRENMWLSQEMKNRIGSVVSQVDTHRDRTQSTQEEMEAKMNIYKEIMEAAIRRCKRKLGPR
jgi:hypothetical protein